MKILDKLSQLIDSILVQLLMVFFKSLTKLQTLILAFNYLKLKQIISRFRQA